MPALRAQGFTEVSCLYFRFHPIWGRRRKLDSVSAVVAKGDLLTRLL